MNQSITGESNPEIDMTCSVEYMFHSIGWQRADKPDNSKAQFWPHHNAH